MNITKVTPILVVDAIEPCLALWKDQLGYEALVEVPHGARLGFVLLSRGESHVMMQTKASMGEDLPAVGAVKCLLYLDVDSIEAALANLKGAEVVVPTRVTPYGMREVFVKDGSGNVIGFAAKAG